MSDILKIDYARELDASDTLRLYRKQFLIGDDKIIYLNGNSLGRLPLKTAKYMENAIKEQWGERLVKSWNEGWYQQSARLGKKIAQIIGAHPEEVILADSTSVNLYKLAYGALKLQAGKTEIISDDLNFPSDLYVLQGLIEQFGGRHNLTLLKSPDSISSDLTELLRMVDKQTALLSLSHVAYKSAYMYDMERVTQLAHMHGALVLWDLSHSVGAVPVNLNRAGVDLAVGCTYKYLNGGPGCPAFLYVKRELQEQMENPVKGWFGEKAPFEFNLRFRETKGIRKYLTGTPPIVSISGLEPALDMVLEAGIGSVRKKGLEQGSYLLELARAWLFDKGFRIGSPELSDRRGSHITLKHAEAYRISRALNDPEVGKAVVIPDFREPNNLRFGITPLYTSYEEIYLAMEQLRQIIESRVYENYPHARESVT